MTPGDITNRYAWQFRGGRGIDHCVPPQWLPLVEALCNAIGETISEADRPAFYWLDIKEKRGELSVAYVAPAHVQDAIDALVEATTRALSNS